jgi:hypothetical protein
MTSRFAKTLVLASGLLAGVVGVGEAFARQNALPQPTLIQPTTAQQRFRQAVTRNQANDQIQKARVEHAIRQQSLELARRPAVTRPAAPAARHAPSDDNDKQTDQAKQADDQLYRAQQRDRVQRYSDALRPQPVPQARPANADQANGG